jgi:hypothetical protein
MPITCCVAEIVYLGEMTPKEIIEILNANIGKKLRIAFSDGVIQSVEISSVDDEGFLHSGPDGGDPQAFWTRFEDITFIEPCR